MKILHLANRQFSQKILLFKKKFVEVIEDLKLTEKLDLNVDKLFDEVILIKKNCDSIQSSEHLTRSKTSSSTWHVILKKC